jgi:hypothetical protein
MQTGWRVIRRISGKETSGSRKQRRASSGGHLVAGTGSKISLETHLPFMLMEKLEVDGEMEGYQWISKKDILIYPKHILAHPKYITFWSVTYSYVRF